MLSFLFENLLNVKNIRIYDFRRDEFIFKDKISNKLFKVF